ncbi:MAG TPA: ABC transporter substrate-binding protein, partial [Sphingomonas sp.]|nr:ABC transporter substrate-binding protein [Sphingomonas sp.]
MKRLLPAFLAAALVLGGCDSRAKDGVVTVSVIGERFGAPGPAATVTGATSGGLVRFDREGQIVPGAAARWAILDDG